MAMEQPNPRRSIARGQSNAWPPEVKQRARDIWSSSAGVRSAARTEYLMMQEAKADAGPDAYVLDRVPSASTIKLWVRQEGWREQANAHLLETMDEDQTDHDVQLFYMRTQAVETLALCQAGAYDHDPKLLQSKLKEAELGFRVSGAGTYGSQFGRTHLPISKLSAPDTSEQAPISPQEHARLMRDRVVQDKQGGRS